METSTESTSGDRERAPPPVRIVFRNTVAIEPLRSSVQRQDSVLQCDGKSYAVSRRTAELASLVVGCPSLSELCERVNAAWGTQFDQKELHALIKKNLGPLLEASPGSPEQASKAPEAKTMLFSFRLVPEAQARLLARMTAPLYHPVVASALIPLAALCAFLAWRKGFRFGTSIRAEHLVAGYLISFGITLFHEIGHAAALWRFFRRSGPVYAGLYFIIPAMFIKADGAWGGRRMHRFLVDVGGIYFQLLAFIPLYLIGFIPGFPPALFGVGLTVNALTIFTNLNPLWNFDAYWMLSTAIGVPNLSKTAAEALKGLLRRLRPGKPWTPVTHARLDWGLALYAAVRRVLGITFTVLMVWHLPNIFRYSFQTFGRTARAIELLVSAGPSVARVFVLLKGLLAALTLFILMRMVVRLLRQAGQGVRALVRKHRASAKS